MTMSSGGLARIVDAIIVTLLALAIAIGAGRGVLAWLGLPIFAITGSSMAPTLPLGSAVLVTPAAPDRIAVGDIVTFQRPGQRATTHRVVGFQQDGQDRYLVTQGDANPVSDPSAIPASWVSGRVTVYSPILGYVLVFLSLPTGWVSLLSFLVSLWLAGRLLEDLLSSRRPSAHPRGVVVAGLLALVATVALLGSGTVRTTAATFADSTAVGANSFTTGTWGP